MRGRPTGRTDAGPPIGVTGALVGRRKPKSPREAVLSVPKPAPKLVYARGNHIIAYFRAASSPTAAPSAAARTTVVVECRALLNRTGDGADALGLGTYFEAAAGAEGG